MSVGSVQARTILFLIVFVPNQIYRLSHQRGLETSLEEGSVIRKKHFGDGTAASVVDDIRSHICRI